MSANTATGGKRTSRHIAHRLLISHVLLAVLTASSVTWLSWEISCQAEDTVTQKYLLLAAEQFEVNQGTDGQSLAPLIRIFETPDDLPAYIVDAVDLSPGFHELDLGVREAHLLISERSSGQEWLYVLGDMPEPRSAPSIIGLLLSIILVISLGGVAIGFLLTRNALRPLLDLTNTVSSSKGDELPLGFSEAYSNDEIGTLARQVESYMRQREQFLRRERRFLQDTSHELRTPLTVLQGAIEILRASPAHIDGNSKRSLDRMERSVFRMQHTIECLLWLAHEENKSPPTSEDEFYEALNCLVAEWKAILPSYITLTVNIEPDCVLDGPFHLWLIAIRNLIDNAAHHTDSGRIDVEVGSDRIVVSDTGCGISPEAISKITDAWTHGPQTRGYGLGLSIVNRIAKRMGWSLRIDSKFDQGTTVTIDRGELLQNDSGTETSESFESPTGGAVMESPEPNISTK